MDLSRFLPGLNKHDETDTGDVLTPYEYHRLHAPKHGPVRARFTTAGQQRRAMVRATASMSKKANRRHRRNWLASQNAAASLRGQLWVIDNPNKVSSALYLNVLNHLEDRFNSVDQARKAYVDRVA